ncbi:MAG: hypothetical protein OHK0017_06920 [Patescibacteria group bacterium]
MSAQEGLENYLSKLIESGNEFPTEVNSAITLLLDFFNKSERQQQENTEALTANISKRISSVINQLSIENIQDLSPADLNFIFEALDKNELKSLIDKNILSSITAKVIDAYRTSKFRIDAINQAENCLHDLNQDHAKLLNLMSVNLDLEIPQTPMQSEIDLTNFIYSISRLIVLKDDGFLNAYKLFLKLGLDGVNKSVIESLKSNYVSSKINQIKSEIQQKQIIICALFLQLLFSDNLIDDLVKLFNNNLDEHAFKASFAKLIADKRVQESRKALNKISQNLSITTPLCLFDLSKYNNIVEDLNRRCGNVELSLSNPSFKMNSWEQFYKLIINLETHEFKFSQATLDYLSGKNISDLEEIVKNTAGFSEKFSNELWARSGAQIEEKVSRLVNASLRSVVANRFSCSIPTLGYIFEVKEGKLKAKIEEFFNRNDLSKGIEFLINNKSLITTSKYTIDLRSSFTTQKINYSLFWELQQKCEIEPNMDKIWIEYINMMIDQFCYLPKVTKFVEEQSRQSIFPSEFGQDLYLLIQELLDYELDESEQELFEVYEKLERLK